MGSTDGSGACNDNVNYLLQWFLCMLNIYTNKTAAAVKSNDLITYPVSVFLFPLNMSTDNHRYIIDNGLS